jgi:hypothetical protein
MTHDAYELAEFFSGADYELKEKVLLELCKRDPDFMLDILRTIDHNVDLDELRSFVRNGRKIEAIKRYREMAPGTGLREAKDFVEALKL